MSKLINEVIGATDFSGCNTKINRTHLRHLITNAESKLLFDPIPRSEDEILRLLAFLKQDCNR